MLLIDRFPERAMSVLRSGCLEQHLLRSLSVDKELWESQGGAAGLRAIIHTLQHRAQILLRHIQNKRVNTDLWKYSYLKKTYTDYKQAS